MSEIVRIEMENGDVLRAELYPDLAPNTVKNFTALVASGFYDGTEFHRVIPGFMIQGGAGTDGRTAAAIAGEFTENGFRNDLAHDRGVLSMARTSDPNSASSQFFIMVDKAPHLDGKYAAFGRVIEGMEAADAIAARARDHRDCPTESAVMARVRMEPAQS
ncbi:MAG: peptidylprolyl isomerase [Clostridiales Family XIII bacterium]|jgi:peptidyl-prolyl cis-trans isomerase B (cyclophilin B)|nr:peptidylprolyl isomerase [Clostridiales Family XIII bacterium]